MRVLFDQGTPVPLRNHLAHHQVSTAYELGWGGLANGELLKQAESEGFDVLVTTDQNLKYQQNLAGRRIAIVVLTATSWPRIQKVLPSLIEAVGRISPMAMSRLRCLMTASAVPPSAESAGYATNCRV